MIKRRCPGVSFLVLTLGIVALGCQTESGSSGTDARTDAARDAVAGETPRDQATDPAVDAPVDMSPGDLLPPDVSAVTCDPVAQSCGSGMECEFLCPPPALRCIPLDTGSGTHGMVCTGTCSIGHTCVRLTGQTAARCMRFCNTVVQCPSATNCEPFNIGCMGATPITFNLCTLVTPDAGDDSGDDSGDSGSGG